MRRIFSRIRLMSNPIFRLALGTQMIHYLNYQNKSFHTLSFQSELSINQVYDSSKSSIFVIYDSEHNTPICNGFIVDNDGSFVACSSELSINAENRQLYIKFIDGEHSYLIQINQAIKDEQIILGKVYGCDKKLKPLQFNLDSVKICQQINMIGKNNQDINMIQQSIIQENFFNFKQKMQSGFDTNCFNYVASIPNYEIPGAPVFDQKGQVIGIVQDIQRDQSPFIIIMPIRHINPVIQKNLKGLTLEQILQRPYLGMSVKTGKIPPGAFVCKLSSLGPSYQSGIQYHFLFRMGDTITHVDGQSINSASDFMKILGYSENKKRELSCKIRRGSQEKVVIIELQDKNGNK